MPQDTPLDRSSPWCRRGDELALAGYVAGAAAAYRRGVAEDPKDAGCHFGLGATLEALRRYSEAAESYRRAEAFAPADARVKNRLGYVLTVLGRPEGREKIRESAALDPESPVTINNLGNCAVEDKRWEEARRLYAEAERLCPDMWYPAAGVGAVALANGDAAQAAAHFGRAAAKEFEGDGPLTGLAAALLACGRTAEAVVALRDAVRRRPVSPLAALLAQRLAAQSGDFGLAAEALLAARNGSATAPVEAVAAVEVLLLAGETKAAAEKGSEMRARFPQAAEVWAAEATALAADRAFEAAESSARRALELDPRCVAGHGALITARRGLRDGPGIDDALQAARTALADSPDALAAAFGAAGNPIRPRGARPWWRFW